MDPKVIPPPPDATAGAIPPPPDYVPPKADNMGVFTGAIADTFGLTDRPGAKSVLSPGTPGYRTPLDVVLRPEGGFERAASIMATAAPIAKAGQLAKAVAPAVLSKVAPAVGRVAASGGKGAAEGAYAGDEGPGAGSMALFDAAVAALTEGTLGAVGSFGARVGPIRVGLKEWGEASRGFKAATELPAKALEAVRDRLPPGKWLNVPSLGKDKMTAEEAVRRLVQTKSPKFDQARLEIMSEMNRLDAQRLTGPRPYAGQVFKARTTEKRFDPSLGSRASEGLRQGILSEHTRAVADSAATQDLEGGMPAGMLAIPAITSFAGSAARLVR